MSSTPRSDAQRGVMLLELVTALAIGMMVTLAAFGTLAFMQASAGLQGDAFRLQQRVEVALLTIGEQLQPAGAIELVETPQGTVRFSTAFDGYAGSGHSVQGEEGAGGRPDVLAVSREDDGEARDCLGNRPDASRTGVRIDSRFTLSGDTLRCLGAHAATGSQVVADGVEDFQVHYGLRTPSDPAAPFHFVAADAVAGRWQDVGAIQVCLQVRGDGRHPQAATVRNCRGLETPADGRLRQVAHATFALRNAAL
ncbi:PilW family protein [Pseudorhodoferax sp.]|uniref:PilW family protein n=1 Tax=Pseudorhodoferax sp. TaxID=1993553 RepID=UPI0039E5F4B8